MNNEMNIESAVYSVDAEGNNNSIQATIDGIQMSVPLDPTNRHCAEIMRQVEAGEAEILPYINPINTVDYATQQLQSLYDAAMHTLQDGYTDEEVKTFTPKQDAIREYKQGGVTALSGANRLMLEGLTGSSDDAVISAKLDRMYEASATFKSYLGVIERLRDEHIDQLVDGQDNSSAVESLKAAYAALGG